MFFKKLIHIIYKFLFSERTILFVTNKGIKTIKVGLFAQGFALLTVLWIGNLFVQSLHYKTIISNKTHEISRLESINDYFGEEVELVNDKLKKINEYLISATGFEEEVENKRLDPTPPEGFKGDDLSYNDRKILFKIRLAESRISSVQLIAQKRIKKIQNAISVAGLNLKNIPTQDLIKKIDSSSTKSISNSSKISQGGPLVGQGGPFEDIDVIDQDIASASASSDEDLERELEKVQFVNELDHLIVLEKIANIVPFSKPMKKYYISSGFGSRVDPVNGTSAKHRGLDFVGSSIHAEIISPSKGKVILAGKYHDYGNAVVIDHGFGVTTRYGHLSEVKVKKGQIVTKGELIALQGSTGRSTGPHLHYEVRYKNKALDPKKFLKAGELLFNDTNT